MQGQTDIKKQVRDKNLSLNDQMILLFSRTGSRQEYFKQLVKTIQEWTHCGFIGIRVKDDKGNIPYESFVGFPPEFIQSENWLCINHDQCICTRVIAGKPENFDLPFMTQSGSFYCGNTLDVEKNQATYHQVLRGVCMEKGYKSLVVIPIVHKNQVIGAIHIADLEKEKVPEETVKFLESIIPVIADTVHKFEMEKELEQNYEVQKTINQILLLSLGDLSTGDLMHQVLKIILSTSWFQENEIKGQIFLAEDEYEQLSKQRYHFLVPKKSYTQAGFNCRFILFASSAKDQENISDDIHNHYATPITLDQKILGLIKISIPVGQGKNPLADDFLTIVANTLAIMWDRQKTLFALKKSQESLTNAQRIAHLGNWEWDLIHNEIEWSQGINRIFGLAETDWPRTYEGLLDIVHPKDKDLLKEAVNRALTKNEPLNIDHRILRPDESVCVVHEQGEVIYDEKNRPVAMFGTIQDVTSRKVMEERLEYLATHDFLTKVPNRFSLEKRLLQAVENARRGVNSALLFIDLDNFKLINDAFGHSTGDELLISLVTTLKNHLRLNDALFRFGGDEFAVLLHGVDEKQAGDTGEKLRKILEIGELCATGQKHSFDLTISIGIVMIDGTMSHKELLSYADTALYAAKEGGKNRVVFLKADDRIKENLTATSKMLSLVKLALREDLFTLYFQPVVDINAGKISHYEALLRIKKSRGGELVMPEVFIPVAESFGLMSQIDRWVIQTTLDYLKRYQVIIYINLSGTSMAEDHLLEYIQDGIIESKIDPARLGFEITETSAVKDFSRAEKWISLLHKLGCKFALDDFGVGFSSFSYLRNLPVDFIKIDGSFIKNIDRHSDNRAITEAINKVAHILGKKTIAEYVTSNDVLNTIRELGVDCGQGYFLGEPVPDLNRIIYPE